MADLVIDKIFIDVDTLEILISNINSFRIVNEGKIYFSSHEELSVTE